MEFFRELTVTEKSRCIVASYEILTNPSIGNLRDAAWALAIGQSVGNPKIRNSWESDDLFEQSSVVIYASEKELSNKNEGVVSFGFPIVNTNFNTDGISHLLCQLLGGQFDIDVFNRCRLLSVSLPDIIRKDFKAPKYGISGIREYTGQFNKPLSGAIIKPKTGISPYVLGEMVKELIDGGVDFIKEDEILSSPSFCKLEDRVELISNIIRDSSRKVVYCFCINSDVSHVLDRAKFVASNGGNGVHLNIWSGLGTYKSIRDLDLPLFIHYQKSGDKAITDSRNPFGMTWFAMCQIASLCGIDSIHAGMWGGYLSENENDLNKLLELLRTNNILPALSCGMHPGIVNETINKFGPDFLANCGGSIHGHPDGTKSGAMAMRQSIDQTPHKEFYRAIEQWGYVGNHKEHGNWVLDF